MLSYYQRYQNMLHIPHSKYTHLQTCKILTKKNFFFSKFILSGRSKIGKKKAKLQKAKTNDLILTKYAYKNKLKLPISICLVSPSPT